MNPPTVNDASLEGEIVYSSIDFCSAILAVLFRENFLSTSFEEYSEKLICWVLILN
jgi:hypothetical protein